MSEKGNALVIGAGGGLGKELVIQLQLGNKYNRIHAVSRHRETESSKNIEWHRIDSTNEDEVRSLCDRLSGAGPFSLVVCCIGILKGDFEGSEIGPEKRLEDLSAHNLLNYFHANTVLPAIWLRHTAPLLKGSHASHLVFFSARVGSITDNMLGGWYGYRASKAALNMLLKTAQVEFKRRAPNVCLVSYHPGTVDTALSKPFQNNVPKGKLFTPEFSVNQLLSHLPTLTAQLGPHFIDWQGESIAW